MNARLRLLLLGLVLSGFGLGSSAVGQVVSDPAVRWDRAAAPQFESNDPTYSIGWEFRALDSVSVTSIGVYDTELPFAPQGGLHTAKAVGLWDLGEQPLALASVAVGQGAPLCQDGYRYVTLDNPVTLVPGRRYVVAAFWPGTDTTTAFDDYPDVEGSNTLLTFDSRIQFLRSRRRESPVFGFPDVIVPGTQNYLGAVNFRIGEGGCEPNPPADLATTFEGGNNQAGAMFDLRVLGAEGLRVTSWQVNLDDAMKNQIPIRVTVFWRKGTHVGHTASSEGWTLLGSETVLGWGPNQATPVPIGGLDLPPGETIGVYMTTSFVQGIPSAPPLRYSDIGTVPGTYSNGELEITGGVGKGAPFFDGPTIPQRMWNGGVLYEPAGTWLNLGCGLGGSLGELQLVTSGTLETNAPLAISVSNGLPLATAFLLFGTATANANFSGGVIVPVPSTIVPVPLTIVGSQIISTVWPGGLPSGSSIYFQAWSMDPGGPQGWSASNAVQGILP